MPITPKTGSLFHADSHPSGRPGWTGDGVFPPARGMGPEARAGSLASKKCLLIECFRESLALSEAAELKCSRVSTLTRSISIA